MARAPQVGRQAPDDMAPVNKTISLSEFKGLVRARVTEAESLRKLATTLGTSAAALSRLLTHAEAVPGPALLKIFGYRRAVRYEKIAK